mmetsp:Transcript_39352/g.112832  ORF Transcript_39352/g.112832 Transcript_39352/m.112832 type:complete len:126 (+) Transcript_39352:79-456(+)
MTPAATEGLAAGVVALEPDAPEAGTKIIEPGFVARLPELGLPAPTLNEGWASPLTRGVLLVRGVIGPPQPLLLPGGAAPAAETTEVRGEAKTTCGCAFDGPLMRITRPLPVLAAGDGLYNMDCGG